jgi:hypothetical protein
LPGPYAAGTELVSLDEARRLALRLPEAVEQDHHGRPSFRVGGKILATQWDDGHMNLMLDQDAIRTAIHDYAEACEEVWWGKEAGRSADRARSRGCRDARSCTRGRVGREGADAASRQSSELGAAAAYARRVAATDGRD